MPTPLNTNQLQQRNRELAILHQIAAALNQEVNLHQALQTTLAQVAELFDLHTGWIFLFDTPSNQHYLASAQHLPPALAEDACALMENDCTCLEAYRKGGLDNPERLNVITCSRLKGLLDGTNGLRYHASIPLKAHNKALGVLNVASAEANWWKSSAENLRLLHTVGDLLSIAIERAYLFEESTQLGRIEERNRLAREIHDTLAQSLTGISLRLETVDAMLETDNPPHKIRQTVQETLTLAQSTLEEARRSVLDLRAAPLEGHNLASALANLTQTYNDSGEFKVTLHVIGGHHPLPVRIEVGLFRIVQEGLTNISRHAQATQVIITLAIIPQQIQLIIEDNGQGFEPDSVPVGHFGLIGLAERVKLLNGEFTLKTAPGDGVRVEVVIPL